MDCELTEQELRSVYQVKGSPWFWRRKAAELRCAAELIYPHAKAGLKQIGEMVKAKNVNIENMMPSTFNIFLALIGFSTEALFKGQIIKENTPYLSNRKMAKLLKTHDLIKLASYAKLQLSQHERAFCKQAFHAMAVDFRYPIPSDGRDERNSIEVGGDCKEVFEQLYEKLYPELGYWIGKGGKLGKVDF